MRRLAWMRAGIAGLLIIGILAACASTAQDAAAPQGNDAARDGGGGAAGVPGASGAAGGGNDMTVEPGSDGGLAAPAEQRIIKTGEVTLEVASVAAATGSIRAMTTGLGGYVGGSQAGTETDSATLTLRIPAARFDEALAALREMDAEIVAEATREEDVTGQVVDLRARIANLEASEASYRQLVERAERIEDILAVQTRLDGVRGEIEQLQAQLDNVSAQADLSTLTVTLVPRAEPVETETEGWDPGADFKKALASLVGVGQGVVSALIWIVIVWVPLMAVLALLIGLVWRGSLEVRRRLPATVPSRGADDRS
jgi:HPt (histidine-containing phosphotransfer) domain-containing protein